MALCFGKAGDGWLWMTTLDPAGSPYLGITTWQGTNPYTDGNRTHRLRLGQLKGVSGVNEWGLQSGTAPGSYIRFTDIRNEIHGTRLSLYGGDGAQLRVTQTSVVFYRTANQSNTLTPDSDSSSLNTTTTEGTFWQAISGGGSGKYAVNAANLSGYVSVGLSNPTAFSSIHHVDLSVTFTATGFANDTARVYGQVFESDEVTPLTGELLILQKSSNVGNQVVTVTLPHDAAATKAKWDGAKLRLRWEYDIAANQEAIRLDPSVPSLAIGNPLPSSLEGGGDGFWVGRDVTNQYKFRLGKAGGQALRWDSYDLFIRDKYGNRVIEFTAAGDSRFAGAMTIGPNGGIWQGTGGSFAAPRGGLKIWNANGVGRFETYDTGGNVQISFDSTGRLTAGNNNVILDKDGMAILPRIIPGEENDVKKAISLGVAEIYSSVFISGSNPDNSSTWRVKHPTSSIYTASIELGAPALGGSFISLYADEIGIQGGLGVQGKGIAIGLADPPTAGVLRIKERTDNNTYPNSTQVDIFARTVGGVQKLYAKFGNGVVRELATAS